MTPEYLDYERKTTLNDHTAYHTTRPAWERVQGLLEELTFEVACEGAVDLADFAQEHDIDFDIVMACAQRLAQWNDRLDVSRNSLRGVA